MNREPVAAPPRVSVVVPCLNEERYLGELLAALHRQTRKPDEIVVVFAVRGRVALRLCRATLALFRASVPRLARRVPA